MANRWRNDRTVSGHSLAFRSSLAGERGLLQPLAALTPALTVAMIAHRMESLSLCDQVVVIDRGGVAREERFEDLTAYLSDPSVRASRANAEPSQEFDLKS